MSYFLWFLGGVALGIIVVVLFYYNNTQRFIQELEALRDERDALKRQISAIGEYLRNKHK